MTQAELVDEIISLRQFRRYLNGKYIIPQYVINEFSKKLGFKPEYIVIEFESDKKKETQKLNEFHNYIVSGNIEQAKSMLNNNIFKYILDNNNKTFFDYSMILFQYYDKKITDSIAIYQTKQLIHYDRILNNHIFSSTEIIILTSLMGYKSFDGKEILVKLFEKYILDPTLVISGHNVKNILLCLNYMIEYYGMNENYERVIFLANKGIDFAMETKTFYLLVDFYYFLSLAYFAIGDTKNYEKSMFNCYNALHLENNPPKIKRFYKLIEDDFNIDFDTFIISYIKRSI